MVKIIDQEPSEQDFVEAVFAQMQNIARIGEFTLPDVGYEHASWRLVFVAPKEEIYIDESKLYKTRVIESPYVPSREVKEWDPDADRTAVRTQVLDPIRRIGFAIDHQGYLMGNEVQVYPAYLDPR